MAVGWSNLRQLAQGAVESQHIIAEAMAAIMGATNTPAEGREKKPIIKVENKPGANHGRDKYIKKEKFLGADPSLRGSSFELKRS